MLCYYLPHPPLPFREPPVPIPTPVLPTCSVHQKGFHPVPVPDPTPPSCCVYHPKPLF